MTRNQIRREINGNRAIASSASNQWRVEFVAKIGKFAYLHNDETISRSRVETDGTARTVVTFP